MVGAIELYHIMTSCNMDTIREMSCLKSRIYIIFVQAQ
jgi:hypothetical protein